MSRRSSLGGRWPMLLALALAAGCDSSTPVRNACSTGADCRPGQTCVDGMCRDREDAGSAPFDSGIHPVDAGPYARPFCPDFPFTTDDCGDPEKEMYIERRDSDEDGLTDLLELCEHSTDPCNPDSDGDGVNDLIETAYGSDPRDAADNPRERGDFVFVVPYSPPDEPPVAPSPERDALSFGTALQKLDLYIAVDTSGSMDGELNNLRDSFRSTVVPELAARIPDIWFGVGRFAHCPGSTCAHAMINMRDMTGDVDLVQTSLDTLVTTCGSSEPYYQTLWLVATGDTGVYGGVTGVDPVPRRCTDPTSIGWPCFRSDAMRVVVQVGDEAMGSQSGACSSSYPGRTQAEAVAALNANDIHFIGIDSSTSTVLQREMREVATMTGSVDATTGEPIYFRVPTNGTGLGENLVDAIVQFSTNVPIRVDAVAANDPTNPGGVDAAASFIERLETNTSEATVEGRVCTTLPTGDADGDGHPDHYPSVFPGTTVCFDVIPKPNQTVPATEEPQIFRARIRVIGNMSTPLDEREALFLVPPVIAGPI